MEQNKEIRWTDEDLLTAFNAGSVHISSDWLEVLDWKRMTPVEWLDHYKKLKEDAVKQKR